MCEVRRPRADRDEDGGVPVISIPEEMSGRLEVGMAMGARVIPSSHADGAWRLVDVERSMLSCVDGAWTLLRSYGSITYKV